MAHADEPTLYYHPLSSFCHKVLIALYELGTGFSPRLINPGEPEDRLLLDRLWPVGKMPVLQDGARVVAESSIIIEYLDRPHGRLIPADPDAALQVRLWDRFFDLYVHDPMQRIVADKLRPPGDSDPLALVEARARLDRAFAQADAHLAGREWAADAGFSMADCAATPALFYAGIIHPFEDRHPHLAAYFERLVARPSVARVLDEAQPWFPFFPFHELIPPRFTRAR